MSAMIINTKKIKSILTFIILLIFPVICFSQTLQINELLLQEKRKALNIKSLTANVYKYTGKEKKVKEIDSYYIYDTKGRCTEEYFYFDIKKDLYMKTLYIYDDNNNRIEAIYYYSKSDYDGKKIYFYNTDKLVTQIVFYNVEHETEQTTYFYYDDNNNVIEVSFYTAIENKTTLSYDDNQNLILELNFLGGELFNYIVFSYNSDNILERKITYSASAEIEEIEKYYYNINNMIEIIEAYDSNNTLKEKKEYIYDYY
jgi:outer membrane lipoprotein-sorting protein